MKSGTWRAVLPAEREEEAAMMMDGTNAEENGRRRSATDDVIVASSNAARGEGEIMVLGRGRLLVIERSRRSLGQNRVMFIAGPSASLFSEDDCSGFSAFELARVGIILLAAPRAPSCHLGILLSSERWISSFLNRQSCLRGTPLLTQQQQQEGRRATQLSYDDDGDGARRNDALMHHTITPCHHPPS